MEIDERESSSARGVKEETDSVAEETDTDEENAIAQSR